MLDAIMQLAANNASKQFEVLENVAINVANVNTNGYKTKRFEQYLRADGNLGGAVRVDTSPGSIQVTQQPMDVAIDGIGYLPVTQPDGSVAYTRDGQFAMNSQGYLTTNRGDLIGDGIKLPIDYKEMHILPDGQVQVTTLQDKTTFKTIAKLGLVRFPNAEALKSIGYNKLVATDSSGAAIPDTDSKLKQGCLERANVDVHGQVDEILRLNAGVISNLRIIKFTDDLYSKAVNLKQ